VTGGGGWIPWGGAIIATGPVAEPVITCVEDPATNECVDIDDRNIVGHPQGVRFGTWASTLVLPHTLVDFGTVVRHFPDPLAGKTISLSGVDRRITSMPGADHAVTGAFRAGFGGRNLYGLAEMELGGVTSGSPVMAADSSPLPQMSTMVLGYAGVVGIAERAGHNRIGLEGAAGGRTLIYNVPEANTAATGAVTVPVVEARVRGELWLSPWTAVGASIGSSLIEQHDWMAGVYFALHTRAYGGQR
jgi:hypothetical protein